MTAIHPVIRTVAALMAIASWVVVAAAATDVRLREQVVASSAVVRLGDVAEIISADRAHVRQLAALPLMPSPPAAGERFLRKREVEDLLVAHGQNLGDIRIEGALQVCVQGIEAKSLEPQGGNRQAALAAGRIQRASYKGQEKLGAADPTHEFASLIENYLNTKSDRPATWRVACQVEERYLAQLAAATSPPLCGGGTQPWTGRQRFVVSFETSQGTVRLPVYAEVENLSYCVVVAIQPISRGDVITAASVELRSAPSPPSATGRRAPMTTMEKVIGMEARQTIQEGQVIFSDQVRPPLLVKRGDQVTIASQAGGIRVRTTARACEDGSLGELVQVESLEARERFEARVVGNREMAVFISAPAVPAVQSEQVDAWAKVPQPPLGPKPSSALVSPIETANRAGDSNR